MPRIDQDKNNAVLAGLSNVDWQRWLPHLQPVELQRGQALSHA